MLSKVVCSEVPFIGRNDAFVDQIYVISGKVVDNFVSLSSYFILFLFFMSYSSRVVVYFSPFTFVILNSCINVSVGCLLC